LLAGLDARSGAFDEWLRRERLALRRELAGMARRLAVLQREFGDGTGEIAALERLLALDPADEAAHRELMQAYARAGRYTEALRQYQACRIALRRDLDVAPEPATENLYRELMRRRRAGRIEDTGAADRAEAGAPPPGAAEAVAAAPAPDRSLREAVVLVARLHGFKDAQAALDPEGAREYADRVGRAAAEVVARLGGTMDRISGDQVTAVFGLGGLSGSELERAVRASSDIRRVLAALADPAPLSVACGLAQGQLLPNRPGFPFPLSGRPAADAATLADQASPGQTLLTGDARRALGEQAVTRPVGSPPSAWALESLLPAVPGSVRAPLAGRRAELSLILSLLDRSIASGRGRVIVIRGEAGIGKTRLLQAFLDGAAARGAACHRAEVLDFGQVETRRPLVALAGSLLGIAADATPEDRARAVAEAIAADRVPAASVVAASELVNAALPQDIASLEPGQDARARDAARLAVVHGLLKSACAKQPVILAIEDVHWTSAAEAARLGELAAAIADHRALLVMTTRPDEDPINTAWRARARGCPVTTLDLAPLAEDEARELAGGYEGLPEEVIDDCLARADGHPLFLDQLLRAAAAGERSMPGSVRALVLARMDRLGPRDQEALFAAAVLGLRCPREAVGFLLGDASYSPEPLVDAGLLGLTDREAAFTHALFREAIYDSLLGSVRRDLHRKAADWYAGRDLGVQAGHLAEAGDPSAAAAFLAAAATEAESFRYERALEHARRARGLARQPADLALACVVLGELLTRTGHTHDSIAAFREAIDLVPDREIGARAWLGLADALRIVDRYDEALAALDRAEDRLAGLHRPDVLVRVWTLRGNIHFPRSELDECLRAHERALHFATEAGSPLDEARALGGLGDAWYQRGRMLRAEEHFAGCVDRARRHGALGLALSYAPMLAVTRAFCGRLHEALREVEEITRTASRTGEVRAELLARDIEGGVSIYCADFVRARQAGLRSLELARQLGARRFEAELMSIVGIAEAELGNQREADEMLRDATALALEACPVYCGPWCLSAEALYGQDRDRAGSLLRQGEALLARGCVSHNYLEFYRHAIEFSLRGGDFDGAARHAAALEAYTGGDPLPWAEVIIRRARLLGAARGGTGKDLPARLERLEADIVAMGFLWLLPGLAEARAGHR
jgi:tetratricopeptide (TPR) repeat protein